MSALKLDAAGVTEFLREVFPGAVDHFVIDVKQKPGIKIPDPVKHVEYEESQPTFRQW